MKKLLFITQGILQLSVGLSAIVSGAMLFAYPSGSMLRAPLELLNGSPFSDFLLPGIILFLVNGVGQLLSGIFTFRRHPVAAYAGAVFGIALMIWIFIQVNMIGGGHILQYIYFFIGVIETSLAFLICDFSLGIKKSTTARNGG